MLGSHRAQSWKTHQSQPIYNTFSTHTEHISLVWWSYDELFQCSSLGRITVSNWHMITENALRSVRPFLSGSCTVWLWKVTSDVFKEAKLQGRWPHNNQFSCWGFLPLGFAQCDRKRSLVKTLMLLITGWIITTETLHSLNYNGSQLKPETQASFWRCAHKN